MSENAITILDDKTIIQSYDGLIDEFYKLGAQAIYYTDQAIKVAWKIGDFLNKAKANIPHGKWELFFDKNFKREKLGLRHAQQLMKLSKISSVDELNDPAKRKKALFLCGLSPEPSFSEQDKPVLQTWLGKMKTLWKKGAQSDQEEFLSWVSS